MKATGWWGLAVLGAALAGCGGKVETVGGSSMGGGTTTSTETTTGTTTTVTTGTTTTVTTGTGTTTTVTAACGPNQENITQWFVAGQTPQKYKMGLDPSTSCNGEPSVSLSSSTASDPGDFGTLMHTDGAAPFAGKRLRLTGFMRTTDVTGWAGLWLRVDGPQKAVLAFDNMMNCPVTGTTDWTSYQVVLDVAPNAVDVAYGVLLANEGAAWLDGVRLEVVDTTVPVSGC